MANEPFRKRALTLLAQVVSVVFAVLVALAVDEWWEERENAQLAQRTLDSIAQEIRRNRAELELPDSAPSPGVVIQDLGAAIETYRDGGEADELSVNWDVGLLSSAAWETAQLARVTQFMELERLVELARLYQFQEFYAGNQDELVTLISRVGAGMERDPVATLIGLRSQFAITANLRQTLSTLYACTLIELEGEGAVEEGACPGGEEGGGG